MKNIFAGNLSFQTSESELRGLFEPFGQVGRVHMAMDRETGRARGFGFVEMNNDDEAKKAIAALDGKELGGRKLKVNEARAKEKTGSSQHNNRGASSGNKGGRRGFSTEDYGEAARQPREPRW